MKNLVLWTAICLFQPVLAFGSPTYSIQTVSNPGGNGASANALNNAGEVGGQTWNASTNHMDAFVWKDGQMTIVASGDRDSGVLDINSVGDAVGYSHDDQTGPFGFLYRNGQTRPIPQILSDEVYSINDAGVMTVFDNANRNAALYDGHTVKDLGTFGGDTALAIANNNEGSVVSRSVTLLPNDSPYGPLQFRLFETDSDGTSRELQTIEGPNPNAAQINDSGVVVGNDAGRPVYWVDGAPTFLVGPRGEIYGNAMGINSAGVIVGSSDPANGDVRAAFWQQGIGSDLNDLIAADSGWDLEIAYAINDSGQIAGTGLYNGQQAAFLLTPTGTSLIPEPAACSLAISTASALLLLRRRRTTL